MWGRGEEGLNAGLLSRKMTQKQILPGDRLIKPTGRLQRDFRVS